MTFAVLAYNFPHWKTQAGLINLVTNGFKPDVVVLQDRKELNVPQSKYRITPTYEYLQEPRELCKVLGLTYIISDHNKIENIYGSDMAIILGARILSKELIERFPKGILNIHPGILPGNRGLDNLKHSIVKGLPIGVTAHMIDERIDMGTLIASKEVPVFKDDNIRDVYLRQRNYEQALLIGIMKGLKDNDELDGLPCPYSEKFGIINAEDDFYLEQIFNDYKHHLCVS